MAEGEVKGEGEGDGKEGERGRVNEGTRVVKIKEGRQFE